MSGASDVAYVPLQQVYSDPGFYFVGGGVYQRMNNGLPGRYGTIQLPPKPYCVWAYREITGDIGVSIIKEGG